MVNFIQMNLQHAKVSSDMLCRRLSSDELHVSLIQEPWINGGKVKNLSVKNCKLLYDNTDCYPVFSILSRSD